MLIRKARAVLLTMAVVVGAAATQAGLAADESWQMPQQVRTSVSQVYEVPLYKSTLIPLERSVQRISVGNPGVADILIIRNRELYVVGKAIGNTNVVVWDDSGQAYKSFDVEVTHDLGTLRAKLHTLVPGEQISVQSAQEQIVLSGQVSSTARMDAALTLAQGFLPECIRAESSAPTQPSGYSRESGGRAGAAQGCKQGTVVNLMQVGGAQQVMLKVTVSEMAHDLVKKLDANFNIFRFGSQFTGGAVSGGAAFPNALIESTLNPTGGGLLTPVFGGPPGLNPIGPPMDLFDPTTPVIDTTGLFFSYLGADTFLEAVLDISKRNGQAKVLSEPTLTTLSGQQAQFLSGGEFPVPVPQGGLSNSITIEFKEFGVGLKFLPVVLDSGHINLKLDVSVSDISADNSVVLRATGTASTFVIPSLTKRSASNTIELGDGQTIGIAGLINDTMREFVDKFPLLGDLPILGALFRSQEYRSGQSELVIFVTPHLVKPITQAQVKLPTDTFVPPGDLEFYLLGSLGSEKERPPAPRVTAQPISREELPPAKFGHQLGEPQPIKETTP